MNWNRAELKARAEGDLSKNYLYAFLVSFLIAITGGRRFFMQLPGALAFGIGVLFVQPYYAATNAELYFELRQQALNRGTTTEEELRL